MATFKKYEGGKRRSKAGRIHGGRRGKTTVFRPVLVKVRSECSQGYVTLSKEFLDAYP